MANFLLDLGLGVISQGGPMSLQKLSLSLVLSISVLLAACGGSQNKDKSAERTQI